jgi:hypothetical protein
MHEDLQKYKQSIFCIEEDFLGSTCTNKIHEMINRFNLSPSYPISVHESPGLWHLILISLHPGVNYGVR